MFEILLVPFLTSLIVLSPNGGYKREFQSSLMPLYQDLRI